jgi:hypothetical protein
MRRFSKELYPTVRDETFFESCGVADLIATCYGGRNRLVAMEYTRQSLVSVQECRALCWACDCCTLSINKYKDHMVRRQTLVSRCSKACASAACQAQQVTG